MNAMKNFRHTPKIVGLNYEDLCAHPHLEFLKGLKVPKFNAFTRVENHLTHFSLIMLNSLDLGKMRLC